MPLPVYDLSGLHKLHSRSDNSPDVSCSVSGATCQARSSNRDSSIYQVCLAGKHPFILAAVITEARIEAASHYIRQHLYQRVTKAFKSQSQHSVSPIYNILLKLNSNFKDTSPYGDSLFPHTVLSACLLDIRTGLLHTISYGAGSQPPHVASLDRIMLQPAMVRNHFTDGVQVQTGTYELDLAQHLVTLGSPGLWSEIYPSKAAVHARIFSSHTHALSASTVSHDPASSVLRSALRSVVARCAPSSDARLASLYNIKQLDRLPVGSKSEASRAGIIPRRRGDVHSDLTTLTLTLQVHPQHDAAPTLRKSRSRQWFAALAHPSSLHSSLHSKSSQPAPVSPRDITLAEAHSSLARPHRRDTGALGDLAAILQAADRQAAQSPAFVPPGRSSPTPGLRTVRSSPQVQSLALPAAPALTRSMRTVAHPEAADGGASARRRWALLRLYVTSVRPAERSLRCACWDAVLTALGSTLPAQRLSPVPSSLSFSTTASSPRAGDLSRSTTRTSSDGQLAHVDEAGAAGGKAWTESPAPLSHVH